jgi:hypothetical protein
VCWERFGHRMCTIHNSGLLSFILVRMIGRVALHQATWSKKLNNKLNVVISLLSETETKSKSESFTILFYDNPLNSARGCIQTVVTADVATENVRMSRHWKVGLVAYGICKQPSPNFVCILNLIVCRSVQSIQKVFSNSSWRQNHIAIKLCIRIDCMSNQQKDEFVNGNLVFKVSGRSWRNFIKILV